MKRWSCWLITLEKAPGLLPFDIDLGYMASPRIAQWAEQGVSIIARPWPQVGPLFTEAGFHLGLCGDAGHLSGCPDRPHGPREARHNFPAAACNACALRGPVYESGARARQKPEHPRGRTVPAEAASQDEDAAWTGLAAETDGGGACDCPSVRRTKAVGPAIKACAKTSLMAGVMQRSATSRLQHIMRRSIALLPEVLPT